MTDNQFWYHKMKAQNRCVRCGKEDAYTMIGKALCAECTEKKKEYYKKWNARRKEQNRKRNQIKVQKAKETGMCIKCFKRKAIEGKNYCEKCRNGYTQQNRRKVQSNGKLSAQEAYDCGLCMLCRKKPLAEGKKQCPECYEKLRQNAIEVNAKRNLTRAYLERKLEV